MKKILGALLLTIVAPFIANADDPTAQIIVRDGTFVSAPIVVSLPTGASSTPITPSSGPAQDVAGNSVLAKLVEADATSTDFAITDLQYYSSFSSFYLKCILVPAANTSPDCDNWQYTVNGSAPPVGMDQYVLSGGEIVYVYFGAPRTVSLSATSIEEGGSVTATAQAYDPISGNYTPITGYTIGLTQSNPLDPYTPLEILTSPVNGSGQVLFTVATTGTYAVGIKEDYYSPTTPLTVTPTPTIPVVLQVETGTTTLFNAPLSIRACEESASGPKTINGKCALDQSGLAVVWSTYGTDYFLDSINGVGNDYVNNYYWGWFNDLSYGQTALNKHTLSANETLLVQIERMPLRISAATSSPTVGATTTVTIEQFGFDASFNGVWSPAASSTVSVDAVVYETDTTGLISFVPSSTSTVVINAQKTGFISAPSVTLTPFVVVTPTGGGGTPAPSGITHTPLHSTSALSYLLSKQQSNGSFGSLLYTDWAALALKAAGAPTDSIRSFLTSSAITDADFVSVTDHERHAMALMALGVNPYSGRNHIAPITASFDGTQIGNTSLVTDDIFALIVLTKVGYTQNDDIIKKIAAFVLSKQKGNGSWENSPDVTAAAMQAMGQLFAVPGVNAGLGRAIGYTKAVQNANGGWGNPDSTAWVMTALNALNEAHPTPESAWAGTSGYYPSDALRTDQAVDGGMKPITEPVDARVWTTSYALVAASGKSWNTIMQSFSIPTSGGGTPALSGGSEATTTATSTTAATSTIERVGLVLGISTTTSPVIEPTGTTTATSTKPAVKKVIKKKISVAPTPAQTTTSTTPSLEVTSEQVKQLTLIERFRRWLSRWW